MSCSKADACTHLSDSNTRFLTISVGNLHTETLMELALITRSCDRKKEEQKKKERKGFGDIDKARTSAAGTEK